MYQSPFFPLYLQYSVSNTHSTVFLFVRFSRLNCSNVLFSVQQYFLQDTVCQSTVLYSFFKSVLKFLILVLLYSTLYFYYVEVGVETATM